ncbi:MAG: glycosyltransferase family 4 protein [Chloroflexi bacterium]|nr:glycosyltransferase family 4 protein [Chloroflexota bacterium]
MRLAIICSFLNQYGGAERVLEVLHRMYPEAPIYTSVYNPKVFPPEDADWDVRTSFVNKLPLAKTKPQYYLPLYPWAFESFDLRGYDAVLSATTSFAHGVITSSGTRHVSFCMTPSRFLWNYPAYAEREQIGRLARTVLPIYLQDLRLWDHAAADRVDHFLAISRTVQRRIQKVYRRDSEILYPPVQIGSLQAPQTPDDYYLVVSRLVPYKRIDLAVQAFNQLGWPLLVVGEGRDKAKLQAMARSNVRFMGYVSDDEKRQLMARCRAFIFPGEDDFGLTPIEALAMGRPVVAYAAGGALDTIVEGVSGVYFREATPESLADAVRRIAGMEFNALSLQQYALRFDEHVFEEGMRRVLGA